MEIVQIGSDSSSIDRNKLIKYARECPWQGTGRYFADLLENNEFNASEKIFAAIHDSEVIGFVGLVNESCVNDGNIQPWLDFLFVDERYRKQGVAKKLLEKVFASAIAANIGSIYLCTVTHKKMYEKYGFGVLYKTKTNDGDECYIMEKRLGILITE